MGSLGCEWWSERHALYVGKFVLGGAVDIHAPLRKKRAKNKSLSRLTPAINKLMHTRDYLKKKSIQYASSNFLVAYKNARNQINNAIRKAKKIILRNMTELKVGGSTLTDSCNFANAF